MTAEMVGRVSRAISAAAYDEMRAQGFSGGWDHDALANAIARSAVEAMREPTGEMLGDVHDTLLYHVKGNEIDTARIVWDRFIEVALGE